jgi:hypothetical protein
MIDRADPIRLNRPDWSRRRWLAGVTLAGLGALGADPAPVKPQVDPDALDAIRRRAEEAKLRIVGTSETDHYVGIGDAADEFRGSALDVCEQLARTYQKHFETKGLEVAPPRQKMAVVILAGRRSYEAFKGEPVDDSEGGHYDVENNRLVTFDFRSGKGSLPASRERNTFTLVHEAAHQLTYNTGVLDRRSDVPVAVSEGFATYCEVWRKANPVVGKVNNPRLSLLKNPPAGGPTWIPVAELLTEDSLFENPNAEQVAYAESWLLIYGLLQTPARVKKLLAYLAALRKRRDPGQRARDAEGAFGNLDRFDSELKREARRLLR